MSEDTTPAPEAVDTQELPAQPPATAVAPAQAPPAAPLTATAHPHRPMHMSAGVMVAIVIAAVLLLGATFATGFVAGRVSARFEGGRPYMMQRGLGGGQFRRGPMMGAPLGSQAPGGPGMGWRFRGQSQIPGTTSPTPGRP